MDDTKPLPEALENCHQFNHVDVQIGQSNLAKCKICGRVIYRENNELGVKKKN